MITTGLGAPYALRGAQLQRTRGPRRPKKRLFTAPEYLNYTAGAKKPDLEPLQGAHGLVPPGSNPNPGCARNTTLTLKYLA